MSGRTNVPSGGIDTSDATAIAADLILNKTAYVNGVKITGSMTDRGAYNITPSASDQTIPAGYHNGSGKVYGDSNLVAGNIKSGVNIFDVNGTYSGSGTSPETMVFFNNSTQYSSLTTVVDYSGSGFFYGFSIYGQNSVRSIKVTIDGVLFVNIIDSTNYGISSGANYSNNTSPIWGASANNTIITNTATGTSMALYKIPFKNSLKVEIRNADYAVPRNRIIYSTVTNGLTPNLILNATSYSSLTTVVDYSGSGFFHGVILHSSGSSAKRLKITIDGTIILNTTNITSSVMDIGTAGAYGSAAFMYPASTDMLPWSNSSGCAVFYNIPFATSLKIEVINVGASENAFFYSYY